MKKNNKYILACDDDAGIIEIIRIVLEERGYDTKVTTKSEIVFSLIEDNPPALILLDLWMPRLRGEKILQVLKSQPHTKNIPVIIVSASKDTAAISQHHCADDYLMKPFDLEELEAIVDKYIAL